MAQMFSGVMIVVLFFAGILALVFAVEAVQVKREQTFDPAHEEARHQTFKRSTAFRDGFTKELQNMQLEYLRGTPEQKEAIASVILQRTAGEHVDWMPSELRQFVVRLRIERGLY